MKWWELTAGKSLLILKFMLKNSKLSDSSSFFASADSFKSMLILSILKRSKKKRNQPTHSEILQKRKNLLCLGYMPEILCMLKCGINM